VNLVSWGCRVWTCNNSSSTAPSFHGWVPLQHSCVSDPCNTLLLYSSILLLLLQLHPHCVQKCVAPGHWVCVFGSLLVEALLSVWRAFRVWSIACGPLLSDSSLCRCLWCWVLSFPCCAFPPSWSCTRILFSVHPGFRCDVVACTTHVTPFL
jgi:hypothetical protein